MKKVSVIIPVKNEERTIGDLLNKINNIKLNQINFEKEITEVKNFVEKNSKIYMNKDNVLEMI